MISFVLGIFVGIVGLIIYANVRVDLESKKEELNFQKLAKEILDQAQTFKSTNDRFN